MKKYHLHVTIESAIYLWGMPASGFLLFFGTIIFLMFQTQGGDRLTILVMFSPVLIYSILMFIVNWRLPRTIEVHEDGRVVFSGPYRFLTVPARNIETIKVSVLHSRFLYVIYKYGSIRLFHQFQDFHELIAELKRLNPEIQTVGC